MASLVVVLPALPVTPITLAAPVAAAPTTPRSCKARSSVSATTKFVRRQRRWHRVHHHRRRAFFDAASREIVAVVIGSAQRKDTRRRILCPRVHAPTGDCRRRRVATAPSGARNFLKIQGHGSLGLVIPIPLKHFPRHFAIVEVDGLVLQHLVRLVALAGEDDDVACARFLRARADGSLRGPARRRAGRRRGGCRPARRS